MDTHAEKIFFDTIDKKRKDDPLIGVKIGADYVLNNLIEMLRDDKGVHIETLLCILGSLAGYSCQICVREQNTLDGLDEMTNFTIVNGLNGEKYFYGDALNKYIVEDKYSIWSLVAGAVNSLNKPIPDINEIFEYVSKVVGSDKFGIVRFSEGQSIADKPINFLIKLWPEEFPNTKKYCKFPNEYPALFGLALQKAIILAKDAISADVAAKIAMECAIFMSKVNIKDNQIEK
jgi:hypothetical protein